MKSLYLIDISSFIFRAYYAIKSLNTKDGLPVNAVYGVVSMMHRLIESHKPDHLVVCRDVGGKGFRHEIYPAYKANRSAPPEDLVPQFDLIKEFVETVPFHTVQKQGYEADDVIASLVKKFKDQDHTKIYIVSSDKDLMQLVCDNVVLYDPMKDKELGEKEVIEKFGVPPSQVIDVQSLCGDPSDNITGVAGIGPKTAAKLISEYKTLENLLASAEKITGKVGENLRAHADDAILSKKLVTLVDTLDMGLEWDSLAFAEPNAKALGAFYQRLGFKKFVEELGHSAMKMDGMDLVDKMDRAGKGKPVFKAITTAHELHALCQKIEKSKPLLAIDTETDSVDSVTAGLVGVSLCFDEAEAYYIPIGHRGLEVSASENVALADVHKYLGPILSDPNIPKLAQNAKFDLNVFAHNGFVVHGLKHDTMVESYLIDPEGQHNLDSLAEKYLGHTTIKFKDLVAKDQTFADVPIDKACDYAAEDAWVAFALHPIFQELLVKNDLQKIYLEVEIPLIQVLSNMERTGVLINLDFLDGLKVEFTRRLSSLEKKIHELAGEEFNINSPKQLAVILFEKLKLPTVKKTKTGFSTDVDVLEELADMHNLPKTLLEYRTINKLLSTYVEGLKKLTNPKTGRVHTHFNQTIVATGRLSSTEPNLQNIPIKTEEGRRIREAFIVPEGSVMLAADYSQIELRLLAAFSKDPHLVEAYQKNQDIHAKTAAHIFDCALEDVEPHQRSIGKTINFGVIYGQSAFGLAKQLGVPNHEAKRFIDGFYQEFEGVRVFKEKVLGEARENGFVTTYLGRRRNLPDINSSNGLNRQNAERMAFNAVFQGSAADLIKKAMLTIDHELTERKLKTKMIMQVHDELVFEVPHHEIDEVKGLVVRIMEGAFDVGVPLKVSCSVGKNWAEAHS